MHFVEINKYFKDEEKEKEKPETDKFDKLKKEGKGRRNEVKRSDPKDRLGGIFICF